MRVFGIVSFLVLAFFPVSLFAQGGGTGGTGASQGTQVENVSATAAQGGFVGSGRPIAFVGVHEIDLSSGRATTSAARRTQTPTRTAIRPATAARPMGAMTPGRTQLGGTNTQTIRSISALDADIATLTLPQLHPPEILDRIQGIQDGQITLSSSPAGTTATVSGTVPSEWERRVAKQLLLLEPGINRVEDSLKIQ